MRRRWHEEMDAEYNLSLTGNDVCTELTGARISEDEVEEEEEAAAAAAAAESQGTNSSLAAEEVRTLDTVRWN